MKLISTLILTFLLSGCFIFGDPVEFDETTGQTPQWIFQEVRLMQATVIGLQQLRVLEKGEQRYPNSKLAPQFKLDLAYSYYRFSQMLRLLRCLINLLDSILITQQLTMHSI